MKHILIGILYLFTSYTAYPYGWEDMNRLTISNGLSHNTIQSMVQDSDGFLWAGTPDGLNRYDGYSVVTYHYNAKDSNSLPHDMVRALLISKDGRLWVGTDNGLCYYDKNKEHFVQLVSDKLAYFSLNGNQINCLFEDNEGNLWIGTEKKGVFMYTKSNGKIKNYTQNNTSGISSNSITSIHQDAYSYIWIGTTSEGAFRLDKNNETFTKYKFNDAKFPAAPYNNIKSIFSDKNGFLWIGTMYGLNKVFFSDSGSIVKIQKIYTPYKGYRTNWVNSIFENKKGEVIVSFQTESVYIVKDSVLIPHSDFDLTYNNRFIVNSYLNDSYGNQWYGGFDRGIVRDNLLKKQFTNISTKPTNNLSLPDNEVNNIFESKSGELYIATSNSGVVVINKNQTIRSIQALPSKTSDFRLNYINHILIDNHGNFWIAASKGIYFIDSLTFNNIKEFKPEHSLKINDFDGLYYTSWHIMQDKEGIIWVSTLSGLLKVDFYNVEGKGKNVKVYLSNDNSPSAISNNKVWQTIQDKQGNIWVATSEGLNKMDKYAETFFAFKHSDSYEYSISDNHIRCIYQDSRSRIWVGTHGGGLNLYDTKKDRFTSFSRDDGLPDNVIFGILEDKKGNLWLSSNHGLSKFNTESKTFVNFTQEDGLQNDQFKQNAYHKGYSGKFYFGGIQGLTMFTPEDITVDTIRPTLILTSLKLKNNLIKVGDKVNNNIVLTQSIMNTKKIVIHQSANSISIEFAGLHFTNPIRNKYIYMLKGFDKQWIKATSTAKTATYTNLKPGKYVFMMNASNNHGYWAKKPIELEIIVKPYFYTTWWFFSLIIGSVLGAIVLFFKAKEKLIHKSNIFLSYEKKLLDALMDNIPDSIFYKDKNSRFIRINKAKAKSIGLKDPEEAIGKSDFDFYSLDDAREAYNDEVKILKSNSPLINKLEKRIKNDVTRYQLATKVPIYDDNNQIRGIVGLSRDITIQKLAEEKLKEAIRKAEEADQLKNMFLANMSHEIRTPMNAIVGFTEMLSDPDITSDEKNLYIRYIKSNGNTLINIINDILDTAKIEANQLKINKTEVKLSSLLDDLFIYAHQEQERIGKTDIEVIIAKAHKEDNYTFISDPMRLRQILINLLSNAFKFTNKGTIELGFEIKSKFQLLFFVKDTGIGIDPSKHEKIFERFYYTENTLNKSTQGAGLGLSICKKIVELMGGRIWVESEPAKGSTFYFTISNFV